MSNNQASSTMVKTVYSLIWVPGLTPRCHRFFEFEFIKPRRQQVRWRKVPHVHVTREPSGAMGRMVPQVHVTRKPSSPTGWMEMENSPTGWMLKGPAGTRRTEKGPNEDFYDKLQASRMSNCRFHRYTLDGEGSHRYTSHRERIERRLL
jgi:hypothetical protein